MKNKNASIFLFLFLSLLSSLGYFINQNQRQKVEIQKANQIIKDLWDDKIANYQFLVNVTYRNNTIKPLRSLFDSLDTSYTILRKVIDKQEIAESDKIYLGNMVLRQIPFQSRMKEKEIFKWLDIKQEEELFQGAIPEIIERLDKGLNPNFMTHRNSTNGFDIWEKQEKWNLKAGHTTTIMIRLLKNHDLGCNQLEFIPTKKLKIIEPYLGELTVIIPIGVKEDSPHPISFQLYDWVKKDTITKKMMLFSD